MSPRSATVERNTTETQIALTLDLDGSGQYEITTGIGFFDHMLSHIARHGLFDLKIQAQGDIEVDYHHLVEDVGIVLGQAIAEAVGDKRGLIRYGLACCPMDEALVLVALDLGGRAYVRCELSFEAPKVGEFDTELAAGGSRLSRQRRHGAARGAAVGRQRAPRRRIRLQVLRPRPGPGNPH